ncbi:30S ribosomal protein S6 [bacterium]|jgi:small subunit ribosomal protein S6|nr:30S ribosomal protein S6 [bacterium]
MKTYELLAVFKPNADTEDVEKALDALSKTVKSLKGSVKSVEKTGRKKLAYDVQGFRDGFFTTSLIELPESSVAEFRRQLRLNDNILRTMFLEAKDTVKA